MTPARTTRRTAAASRSRCFSSSSGTMRPCSTSTRKSLPGCSRPFRTIVLRRGRRARLPRRRAPTQPSLRLEPAAGPKAVPVEHRTDHAAVGERDRRRPVPRLGQAFVEGVEALAARRTRRSGRRTPRAPSSSARAAATAPRARAARARCRRPRCPSRPGGRPAGSSRCRRRRAPRRAATRAPASS